MGAKLNPLNVKTLGGESEDIELKDKIPCFHKFAYKSGWEIICVKCNVGFFIQGDEELRHGHLYKGNEKIV
jgi:hypothetical protein